MVPLVVRDGEDEEPRQRGLPGVLPEDDPLPSEVVARGGDLSRRRREARAALVAALGEVPEGFTASEWRVVQGALTPDPATPGSASSRAALLHRAREAFPGADARAAVRLYREALDRPHVREAIDAVRSLEALDVLEQRGLVRDALRRVLALAEALDPTMAKDPDLGPQQARIAAAVTAAAKVLVDMDGLRGTPATDVRDGGQPPDEDAAHDPAAAIGERVFRVAQDLARRAGLGGTGA